MAATLLQCGPGGCQTSATRLMLVPPRSRAENSPALRAGRPGHGEDRAHQRRGGTARPCLPRTPAHSTFSARVANLVGDPVSSSGAGSGAWLVAGPGEVDSAGGVESFLRGAGGEAGAQDGVLVAVMGGGVDREAEGVSGAAVAQPA